MDTKEKGSKSMFKKECERVINEFDEKFGIKDKRKIVYKARDTGLLETLEVKNLGIKWQLDWLESIRYFLSRALEEQHTLHTKEVQELLKSLREIKNKCGKFSGTFTDVQGVYVIADIAIKQTLKNLDQMEGKCV